MRPSSLKPIRVFLAIELSEPMQKACHTLIETLKKTREGKNLLWAPLHQLHLTTRFIGNLTPTRVDDLLESVKKALKMIPPFHIQFDKVMLFPSQQNPLCLAMDVQYSQMLQDIFQAVEKAVVDFGLPPEKRPQRAHVTLARFRHPPIPDIKVNLSHLNLGMKIERVTLFESIRAEKGFSRYISRGHVQLG